MKRRGFLKALAGAPIAGPAVVKEAVASTMADLSLSGVATGIASNGMMPQSPDDNWAQKELTKYLGKTAAHLALEKKQFQFNGIEPDVAALRSVSLTSKVRLSRDIAFERSQEQHKSWLEGRIAGLFN